jgi:hypothetical protein
MSLENTNLFKAMFVEINHFFTKDSEFEATLLARVLAAHFRAPIGGVAFVPQVCNITWLINRLRLARAFPDEAGIVRFIVAAVFLPDFDFEMINLLLSHLWFGKEPGQLVSNLIEAFEAKLLQETEIEYPRTEPAKIRKQISCTNTMIKLATVVFSALRNDPGFIRHYDEFELTFGVGSVCCQEIESFFCAHLNPF